MLDNLSCYLPVLFPSSHAFFIHRSLQFSQCWVDDLMVDDDVLNDLIHMRLAGHRVLVIWYGHQCGAKANGQVVGVHHVLVTVLGKTGETEAVSIITVDQHRTRTLSWQDLLVEKCKQVSHDDNHGPLKSHNYLLKVMSSFCTRVKL